MKLNKDIPVSTQVGMNFMNRNEKREVSEWDGYEKNGYV